MTTFFKYALLIWKNLNALLTVQCYSLICHTFLSDIDIKTHCMKIASSNFFAKNLEKPYFPKDTPNYGKAYHKALTYANA